MGYVSDVAVATNKASADKILAIAKEVGVVPNHIINLPDEDDSVILKWDFIKWYYNIIFSILRLHKAITNLDYYDYVILGEDGMSEFYRSAEDSPYILGVSLTYWDSKNKRDVLL